MAKLVQYHLECILYIFIIIGWKSNTVLSNKYDKFEFYVVCENSHDSKIFNYKGVSTKEINNGKTYNGSISIFYLYNLLTNINIFKVSIKNQLTLEDTDWLLKFYYRVFFENLPFSLIHLLDNPSLSIYRKNSSLTCRLKFCNIGHQRNKFHLNDKDNQKNSQFYIGFVKSNEHENLILRLIPIFDSSKKIFSVAVCPPNEWIQNRLTSYTPYTNNYTDILEVDGENLKYPLKFWYCHNKDKNKFLKCGRLVQNFMPSIDVGYECSSNLLQLRYDIYDNHLKEEKMTFSDNGSIYCDSKDLFYNNKNLLKFFSVVPSKNNYTTSSTTVNCYRNETMFYSGQYIRVIKRSTLNFLVNVGMERFGYLENFEAKCIVPDIDATLRLKVNGVVRKFETRIDKKHGKIDTYIVDLREDFRTPVGCHAVPDKIKGPQVKNFYEYRYQTTLLMFNGETGKFIREANIISALEPNFIYKCVLSKSNTYPEGGKPDYIKETKFTIEFIDEDFKKVKFIIKPVELSSFVWIIFGIFIFVSILLIIGIGIFIKLKSKKKKSSDSFSTSTSLSSSFQKTRKASSTVISDVVNVPILGNKTTFTGSKNTIKKVVTKTSNLTLNNNQIKDATKKPTPYKYPANINNQVKNTPKNVVAKISNQKVNGQFQDSVFKIK